MLQMLEAVLLLLLVIFGFLISFNNNNETKNGFNILKLCVDWVRLGMWVVVVVVDFQQFIIAAFCVSHNEFNCLLSYYQQLASLAFFTLDQKNNSSLFMPFFDRLLLNICVCL